MNDSALRLRAAPPLLIGATLIVWGWQCQLLPYAFLMALLVESTSFVSLRWAITDKEFNTLSDFSGVMFAIATVYIFSSEGARGIFIILKVLPFILFPLLLVQKYSGRGMMKLSALLVSLRKLDPALSPEANTLTDISLPFFVVCLVSASVGNQRTIVFFIVVAILIGVVLWSVRPKRYSAGIWLITIALRRSSHASGDRQDDNGTSRSLYRFLHTDVLLPPREGAWPRTQGPAVGRLRHRRCPYLACAHHGPGHLASSALGGDLGHEPEHSWTIRAGRGGRNALRESDSASNRAHLGRW